MTIRDIVKGQSEKSHFSPSVKAEVKQALEINLYKKQWQAMLAIASRLNNADIVAIEAEKLVVAWWNSKQG